MELDGLPPGAEDSVVSRSASSQRRMRWPKRWHQRHGAMNQHPLRVRALPHCSESSRRALMARRRQGDAVPHTREQPANGST